MERFTPLERVDEGRILSEVERQSTAAARQMEQEFATLRSELAYNPAAVEHYREMQLSFDMHLSRLQAGRKEAEALAGVLLKLRQIKEAFLPVLEQVVEKIFALNKDAATFNRTVSVAHLPQTQFLQCRIDLTQLLAALVELDVVVTPEMEQLAASAQGLEAKAENNMYRPAGSTFGTEERT